MNKRNRYPKKSIVTPVGSAYPSPAERRRIIERRDELFQKMVRLLVEKCPLDDPAFARLAQQYGADELQRQLDSFRRNVAERDFLIDEPAIYRKYRQAFARFGGPRRFLAWPEYDTLVAEHALLFGRRKFLSATPAAPSQRENELADLLLNNVDAWEDITPPACPPRPPGFVSVQPEDYPAAVADLLTWGWRLDQHKTHAQAAGLDNWQPFIPDLLRMVCDPGLLEGWPGEADSWAPYHALHLLGALQASSTAARLSELADRENDWLSDRLSTVWAQMGLPVEPVLWDLLDNSSRPTKPRGLVVAGLFYLARGHTERREAVITGFIERLENPAFIEPRLNAYIVHILNRMHAVQALPAITAAFEQNRVDTRIMQLSDVDFSDK